MVIEGGLSQETSCDPKKLLCVLKQNGNVIFRFLAPYKSLLYVQIKLYTFCLDKAEISIEGTVANGAKYLQFSNKNARTATPGVAKTYFKRQDPGTYKIFFLFIIWPVLRNLILLLTI